MASGDGLAAITAETVSSRRTNNKTPRLLEGVTQHQSSDLSFPAVKFGQHLKHFTAGYLGSCRSKEQPPTKQQFASQVYQWRAWGGRGMRTTDCGLLAPS